MEDTNLPPRSSPKTKIIRKAPKHKVQRRSYKMKGEVEIDSPVADP
jgi:hypothetical protein